MREFYLPGAGCCRSAIRWMVFSLFSMALLQSCGYVFPVPHATEAETEMPQATELATSTPEGAEPDWAPQSSGSSAYLNSVFFADANTGWAVGYKGTILKTKNGGAEWESRPSGTDIFLWDVFFVDPDTGWAVGGDFTDPEIPGTVIKTTDGGEHWFPQDPETSAALSSVHFVDANRGWAVGGKNNDPDPGVLSGKILATTDGGATWVEQRSDPYNRFFSVQFIDADTGWVAGDGGKILKTSDGGLTWTLQSSSIAYGLQSVFFLDAERGWAVGYPGVILRTTDGGANWISESLPESLPSSVCFSDADNGWIVGGGDHGAPPIFRSTDGGATWTPRYVNPIGDVSLQSVFLIGGEAGWAVGGRNSMSGVILSLSPAKSKLDLLS